MRALLVEDDRSVAEFIELSLKAVDFEVQICVSGKEAIDLATTCEHDILILDLGLPDMSGFEVLLGLRASNVKIPTLIVSALDSIENKTKGLGCGADDYITKPFHKDELIARINAILRRSKSCGQRLIQVGDILINLDQRAVELNGIRLQLSGKEYEMLELLCIRKGAWVTKDALLMRLYGGKDVPKPKIIDVFICKLRKKLSEISSSQKKYIKTSWGRGYALLPSVDEQNL